MSEEPQVTGQMERIVRDEKGNLVFEKSRKPVPFMALGAPALAAKPRATRKKVGA